MLIPKKLAALALFALARYAKPKKPAVATAQVKKAQKPFIKYGSDPCTCFRNAWGVAVKQGKCVYSTEDKSKRAKVRARAKQEVEKIAKQYTQRAVGEKAHLNNIEQLRRALSSPEYRGYLCGGKFRFGRAQKFVNTYLKCLWCAGKLKFPPPHCPFDAVIIWDVSLPGRDDYWGKLEEIAPEDVWVNSLWRWTQSDDVGHYLLWIAIAKEVARRGKYRSLAEWELIEWDKRASK